MFSSISNRFSALHCDAKMCVGREVIFQACSAFVMGRSFVCVASGCGKREKPPHFRGGDYCCRVLSCVLASARDPGHDAGRVTSTMAGAAHCICPHLCKTGLRPWVWMGGASSSWRCCLKSSGAALQTCQFYKA